jgi:hypothetical protein
MTRSIVVIPAERAGLRPASESRNPVINAVRGLTPAVVYWVPARARPPEAGSLGRDDSQLRLPAPLPAVRRERLRSSP